MVISELTPFLYSDLIKIILRYLKKPVTPAHIDAWYSNFWLNDRSELSVEYRLTQSQLHCAYVKHLPGVENMPIVTTLFHIQEIPHLPFTPEFLQHLANGFGVELNQLKIIHLAAITASLDVPENESVMPYEAVLFGFYWSQLSWYWSSMDPDHYMDHLVKFVFITLRHAPLWMLDY